MNVKGLSLFIVLRLAVVKEGRRAQRLPDCLRALRPPALLIICKASMNFSKLVRQRARSVSPLSRCCRCGVDGVHRGVRWCRCCLVHFILFPVGLG